MERNINARAAENTVRLATIRAISRNPAEPTVTVDDVQWAWAIVHRSIELIGSGVRRHMSDSPTEALRKAILAALEDAEGQTLPHSFLLKRSGVRGRPLSDIEDALRYHIEADQIVVSSKSGKPGRGASYSLP